MFAERHPEMPQQFAALVGVLGRRHHGDVHALLERHFGGVHLGENRLFGETKVEIAGLVKTIGIEAAKVLHARDRQRDHAIEELVHPRAAERDLQAGLHSFADFEIRDRLFRLGANRLLAGDDGQFLLGLLHLSLAFAAFDGESADAHGDDDLLQARDCQAISLADLISKRRGNFIPVALVKARGRRWLPRAFIRGFFGRSGALGLFGSLLAAALLAVAFAFGLGTFGLLFLVVLFFFFLRHKLLVVAVGNAHPTLPFSDSSKIRAAANGDAMLLAVANFRSDARAAVV